MGSLDRIFRRRASSQQTIEVQVQNIIRRQSLAFNGVWYDPSDLSTLFQDAAGTIPVTAAGQPVGLILDKSKGLALGPELVPALDIRSAPWIALAASAISVNSFSTTGAGGFYYPLSPYKSYVITVNCESSAAFAYYLYKIGVSATVVNSANGRFVLTTSDATALYIRNMAAGTLTINSLSIRELPGNHATQSTAGYKPLYQVENGRGYLAFDGIDDFLVTGNVDFSASDKIAVAAGVRKLSEATTGMVCEFSADFNANAGTFFLAAPFSSGAANMSFAIKGTAKSYATVTGVPAPLTCVLSGAGRISTDSLYVRLNGVTKTTTPSDVGTGNFGNYPLYIGSRAGSGLRYNGRLYGLAICGGMDDIYKLKKIEQYLAKKTGVVV